MMNRINLQLVAMGREVTWGRVMILILNFVTFISLILGTEFYCSSIICQLSSFEAVTLSFLIRPNRHGDYRNP